MRPKVPEIVGLIERRLREGIYMPGTLPSERALASQLKVSPQTTRRALLEVKESIGKDVATGQVGINFDQVGTEDRLEIVLLAPAFESRVMTYWRASLERVVQEHNGRVRLIGYVGWSDPVITEVLDSDCDGIFMVPPPMPKLPGILLDRLRHERHRLVMLFNDYTELNIPCVDMGSPLFVPKLVKHVADLGHRTVGIINTSTLAPLIQGRMEAWRRTAVEHGMATSFYIEPVQFNGSSLQRSYSMVNALIEQKNLRCTAFFTTSLPDAIGVMRALFEHGIRPGQDVSVCTCDEYETCRFLMPSVTTLHDPDASIVLRRGLDWILTGGKGWTESLSIHPADIPLFVGESTGPVAASLSQSVKIAAGRA